MPLKRLLPSSVKTILKPVYLQILSSFFYVRRKLKKRLRTLGSAKKGGEGLNFAILCVKKEVYGDMTINNINSLHYQNSGHSFVVYCDSICSNYINKNKKRLDYPNMVTVENNHKNSIKSWQYYKIETLIESSKKSQILIDADSLWHNDVKIDKEKIIIFVRTYRLMDNPVEKRTIENIFINTTNPDTELSESDWGNFIHYVTAFISIPPKFMTEKLASKLRKYNDRIFTADLSFLSSSEQEHVRRLSEEIAVNLALQSSYEASKFNTLQAQGNPGDKTLLEPLYYGCLNHITE